jgi:predicted unusual protein kinase regulating ubiquinone biosynthesis (AarF/ABC1/UbiB family)
MSKKVQSRQKLKGIKTGVFSRGVRLARISMGAGTRAAAHAVGSVFAKEEDREERFKKLLMSQVEVLAKELGQLKGTVMKVGQMISVYGESFLPAEANRVLKSLQNESPPLEWPEIEKVLKRQLGEEKLKLLEIDPEPAAAASLGQVHRAKIIRTGEQIALKVQYPGVDLAIEGDLRALKRIVTVSRILPQRDQVESIFKEVRMMLNQEVDYSKELQNTIDYAARLKGDLRFLLPDVYPEFSTKRVLATRFMEGVPVDSEEVAALSQERRNRLGGAFLELFLKEVFDWGVVQSDPHFGNYQVRIDPEGENDQLILFDFGAIRSFPKRFLEPYQQMARGAAFRNREELERGAHALGFLRSEDSEELKNTFTDLCYLFTEPFVKRSDEAPPPEETLDLDGAYDWGKGDLPTRVAKKGSRLIWGSGLRPPPREVVFLDRKMGGVFIFLSVLRTRIKGRELVEKYLVKPLRN